jgi:ribonuclease-3
MNVFTADERRRLELVLGHVFTDPELLLAALTHRSHSYRADGRSAADYERLEFLGDALLGFAVAEWLYRDDEDAREGVLTWRRATVVRESTLAEAARRLGLDQAIRLGRGVPLMDGQVNPALLADLFEAVLGAVYLDAGFTAGRDFVLRHLADELRGVRGLEEIVEDYKSRLQLYFQARLQRTPRYRIVSRSGPTHALELEVEVLIDDKVLARASGSSRKQAEQDAARKAFECLEDR